MTPFKLLALPALLLSLNSALPASATDAVDATTTASATKLPKIAFEKYTLPNGLDVILVENHKLPVTAVNLWYHVGPANELPGLTGFAHLFEHMMFAATRHVARGEADKLLEGAGATDSNGSTDFDRTNYFDTVPSNQLELALWVHADRMGYLLDVLDQSALSNQQDVVRNERRQSVENRPYGIVEEALYHQLFPKTHPYYASVMGSHADIQSAKLADIRDFFKRYYTPNNASLVIAGDIDKVKTRALVAKYFASFQRGPALPQQTVVTPPISSERRAVVADRVELPRVFMGWLTPAAYTPGDAELGLVAQILAGGKSSRLYKALVYEQQIAQDVSATQSSYALSSVFEVDVTARPGHSAQEIETAIDAELARLRRDGPQSEEVERARNSIETAMLSQIEKVGGAGLANQLNQYNQYLGDPGYLAQDIERYRRASVADIRRVIAEQLPQHARVVVTGVPGTPVLAAEVSTPATPAALKAGVSAGINRDQAWRKQVPKAGLPAKIMLPTGTMFMLSNGLTVIHNYNPALPLVTAELVLKSGLQDNPPSQPGLASFTANMLEEGTSTRSAPQIADAVAQLGAFLEVHASFDATTVAIMALKNNFDAALDIVADVVQHPAFPEAEVERQRASRMGELSQLRENAPAIAARIEAQALYGTQNPYAYGELGTESATTATTREDVQRFWREHYRPNNAALVVSGDISEAQLKTLAEAKFGAWQSGQVDASQIQSAQRSKARLILVDKPGAPQTALRLALIGPDRKTPDFAALQVMNAALGGLFSSRLNTNLREEKGYTYGVHSQFQYRRRPGPFSIAASVRTDVTAKAVAEIFKEVQGMQAHLMTSLELTGARNSQVLSLPGQFETNKGIVASLANTYVYGLGLDYYARLPQRYASVSSAQVQQVAQKYLPASQLMVIGVGDEALIAPQLERLKLGPVEHRDADANLR